MDPALTHDARAQVVSGERSATAFMEQAVAAAQGPAMRHALLRTSFDEAMAVARRADEERQSGAALPALAGLAVSIKDLFDVAGEVTSAGSRVLQDAAPASADSAAVARLRAAGAAFIGRTNMSEFAFSGVGINPHFGTPLNPATAAIDGLARIPGGSTSGGAVSVATGAAWAALGSDTGGSIRIPAALQGLVGFKNTARLTPTEGAVPLSSTLDTVCAITSSVSDAIVVHEVLSSRRVVRRGRPLAACVLAVPTTLMLDSLEPVVASAFERALATLRAAGARVREVRLPELAEVAGLNAKGGFTALESWAWHRDRLTSRGDHYDPRVALRIRRGEAMSAADRAELVAGRAAWIGRVEAALQGVDALLSPTVPSVAPALAPLLADDSAFFAANASMLRNPSIVNFLDGCALSLPCQAAGELPVGLMVWSAALQDDTVLDVGLAIEAALSPRRG